MKRIIVPPPGPAKEPTSQAEVDKFLARKFVLENFLFDRQFDFIQDPSTYKVAVCSRRAGKTVACAAHLIHVAITNKDVVCLYITLAAANAKKLVWKELKKINTDHKLDGTVNESELSVTFSNGSVVYASGANAATEIEKFRGLALKLCYIDECQSFREYIGELIDDIIEPALLDHNGTLCLIGTPGAIPAGYFYECAEMNSTVWSKHHWTFFDNPHIPAKAKQTHQELLARVLKRRGLTIDHPSIQREYFGQWKFDSESLLFKYDKVKNHFIDLDPHTQWHYIMGIDIGWKDSDAICILAYSDSSPTTYLVEECIHSKQGITELVEQINKLDTKYHVNKMVMDMGGLGKKIGEELIKRHSIPVEAADKTRKMENVEFLNDSLRTGRFMAKNNSRFAQDSYLVEIDRDKTRPDKIVVSEKYHSDILDAALYAYKCSPAYAWTPPPEKPKVGSAEWVKQQTDHMFEAEREGLMRENEDQQFEDNLGYGPKVS